MNAGLAPLQGFMNSTEYNSVLQNGTLLDGTRFAVPIVFEWAPRYSANVAGCIRLEDVYSNPIANLVIEDIFRPNTSDGSLHLNGINTSSQHDTGTVYVGGRLVNFRGRKYRKHEALILSPVQMRSEVSRRGRDLIALHVWSPLSADQVEFILSLLNTTDASFVLHAVMESSDPAMVPLGVRVDTYRSLLSRGALKPVAHRIILALLPYSMGRSGLKEQSLRMLIASNYGATHFVVSSALGCTTFGLNLIQGPAQNVSPQPLLEGGDEIPEWFFDNHVAAVLRKAFPPLSRRGLVVMFVGLSGSGKTTLATALKHSLEDRVADGRQVSLIDGDEMRRSLSPGLGFSDDDRRIHQSRMRRLVTEIAKHRGIALVSTIAPLKVGRDTFRQSTLLEARANFVLVHVSTSLSDCSDRDPKQLYRKARAGEITTLAGVARAFEAPGQGEADIIVSSIGGLDRVQAAVEHIMEYMRLKGYVDLTGMPVQGHVNRKDEM